MWSRFCTWLCVCVCVGMDVCVHLNVHMQGKKRCVRPKKKETCSILLFFKSIHKTDEVDQKNSYLRTT